MVVSVPQEAHEFLALLPKTLVVVVGFGDHLLNQGAADLRLAHEGQHAFALLQQQHLALHAGLDDRSGFVLQVGLEH